MLFEHFMHMMIDAEFQNATYSIVDGEVVSGAPVITTVTTIRPMPLRQSDIDFLPEGEVPRDHFVAWTNSEPTISDDDNLYTRMIVGSKTYRIVSCIDREDEGGFYRLILKRI